MIQVRVEILPKPEILDPQGRAVFEFLKSHASHERQQNRELQEVKVGKVVHLKFGDLVGKNRALELATTFAESVLANPLIETFQVEVLE